MITVKQHWKNVVEHGCILTMRPNPTIHHAHGGSIKRIGITSGWARKTSDYLVLPLDAEYHTGNFGIDSGMGVETWEREYGTQVAMLHELSVNLGYDVFKLVKEDMKNRGILSPFIDS